MSINVSQCALTAAEIEELHKKAFPELHAARQAAARPTQSTINRRDNEIVLPRRPARNEDAIGTPHTQQQSNIMARLPQALRCRIWRLILTEDKIFLGEAHGRLVQARKMLEHSWWPKKNLLAVALTCRATYLESINILYECNTFCFGYDPMGYKRRLAQIHELWAPSQLASLHRLEICFHLAKGYTQYGDSHPQAWDPSIRICPVDSIPLWHRVAKAVVQLPALRSLILQVHMTGELRAELADLEVELLEPYTKLPPLERFYIALPWKQKVSRSWRGAPFTIIRKFKDNKRYGATLTYSPVHPTDSVSAKIATAVKTLFLRS